MYFEILSELELLKDAAVKCLVSGAPLEGSDPTKVISQYSRVVGWLEGYEKVLAVLQEVKQRYDGTDSE